MNILDSGRSKKRILGVLGQVMSETVYRRLSRFGRGLPSLGVLCCWALIVSISLLMVSGCGRYKEELETARQQIEKLNSEVNRLTEEAARLKKETGRLSEESNTLSDRNKRMQRDLDELNKAKTAISNENNELKKKNSVAEEEIASLKREKNSLVQEVEQLKKRVADTAAPLPAPAAVPTEIGPKSAKQPEELSPCDAVLAFMKASERIVRDQKGTERTQSLEQVKKQYAPKMKGAPEKAIKAAENWVKEGTKLWDRTSHGSTFRILELRNTVLEACGKSPHESGFK